MAEDGHLTFVMLFSFQVREDPVFRREKGDIHVDAVLNVTQVIVACSSLCGIPFLFVMRQLKKSGKMTPLLRNCTSVR
jgi:hypothetical protein